MNSSALTQPLPSTALAAYYKFWYAVFLFSFNPKYLIISLLITSLTHGLFRLYSNIYNTQCGHIYMLCYAKSLQSCPTLWDPIDGSPPGSAVPGILQERTLEWVAISFSNARKWKVKVKSPSRVQLLETPWTAAHQAPPPMGFSRQEYWSGVPLPPPIHLKRMYILPLLGGMLSKCQLGQVGR